MKNPEHTGAARRADYPAITHAPSHQPAEPVPPGHYVARAMRSTFCAFTVPTIIAPLLPAPLQPLRLLACGALYADQQMQPSDMRLQPAPTPRRECVGILLGLMPYIPAFAFQEHLTKTWCANPANRVARMAIASQRAWSRACERLPREIGRVAARYPINFVLARFAAQMAAVTIGSVLSLGYHRMHGSRQVKRLPLPEPGRRLRERLQARPDAYAACIAPFILPTLLDSRFGRAILQSPRVPRAVCGVVITTAMVGAALVPALVGAENRR